MKYIEFCPTDAQTESSQKENKVDRVDQAENFKTAQQKVRAFYCLQYAPVLDY